MGPRLYAPAVALIVLCTAGAGSASAAIGCGSVITKDTKLKKDIHCANGETGLEIDGDGITLNLDGHTIQGDEADGAYVAVSTPATRTSSSGMGRSEDSATASSLRVEPDFLVDHMLIRRQEGEPIRSRLQRRQGQALAHRGERDRDRAGRRIRRGHGQRQHADRGRNRVHERLGPHGRRELDRGDRRLRALSSPGDQLRRSRSSGSRGGTTSPTPCKRASSYRAATTST